jgi:hypothetical protein
MSLRRTLTCERQPMSGPSSVVRCHMAVVRPTAPVRYAKLLETDEYGKNHKPHSQPSQSRPAFSDTTRRVVTRSGSRTVHLRDRFACRTLHHVGMSDDELHRVSTSSFIPDPGIGLYVRGQYPGHPMPNAIGYLCAVGAIAFPPLGVIAIVLAIRGWRQGRRGARVALLFAVLGTAIGVVIWATFVPPT